MTKGFDRMLEDDVSNRIAAIIELLRYIYGRDLFLKAYEKEYAFRLLDNSSISFQWEEEFLRALKVECGPSATQRMTTMMKDINSSKETLRLFRDTCSSEEIAKVDFNVKILTDGTWPSMQDSFCTLPPELQSCKDKFTFWYRNTNHNRKLSWLYSNGSVEVHTIIFNEIRQKKYYLTVNVF